MSESAGPVEDTRAALIAAGLHLFGRNGFPGTSTREIAARAGANLASIRYHFGGKEGLRAACAAMVAERIRQVLAVAAEPEPATAEEARRVMEEQLIRAVRFFCLEPAAEDAVAFMLREVTEAGPMLDQLCTTFMLPVHRDFCRLWSLATGAEADSAETRLRVFAMIGQVLYFRIARPVVCRGMGWSDIAGEEARAIEAILCDSLRLQLAEMDRRRG